MKKSLLFAFLLGTAMTATAQSNANQVEPVLPIIRKTKCFVTAKRNVLFAKRSVYKKRAPPVL